MTRTARSRASPPATWASARTASTTDNYQPGMELHAKLHAVRRGLPRLADQGADGALQAARRRRSADLRHRHQGAVGDRSGEAQAGPGRPHHRLAAGHRRPMAARSCTTWRTTRSRSASSSGSTTRTRICRRSMNSSASRRTRDVRKYLRGRQAYLLRCARDQRGRVPVGPEAGVPRRRLIGDTAGFLNVPKIKGTHTAMKSGMICRRGGVRQRSPARRRRRADGYPERLKRELGVGGADSVRNIRPAFTMGPVGRHRVMSALDTLRVARQGAVDAARTTPITRR